MNKATKDTIRTYTRNTLPEELSYVGRTLIVPSNAPVAACPTCHGSPVYIIPQSEEDGAGGVYVSCLIKLTKEEVQRLGVEPMSSPTPSKRPHKAKPARAVKGGGLALLQHLDKEAAKMREEMERLRKELEE